MLSLFATAAIKAVLEWLTSLLLRWKEKLDNIEQGRQEVLKKLEQDEKKVDENLKKLGSSRPTDADFANELRDGYNRSKSKNGVSSR